MINYYSIKIISQSNSAIIFSGYFSVNNDLTTAFYDYSLPIGNAWTDVTLPTNDTESYDLADNIFDSVNLIFSEPGLNFYSSELQGFFGLSSNHFNIYDSGGINILLNIFGNITTPAYTVIIQQIEDPLVPVPVPVPNNFPELTTYTDSTSYLQSRCSTYDQKLAYNPVPTINYFTPEGILIEPSNSPSGTQVHVTNNCFSICSKNKSTIYKPNNSQFAQQGGVSSGSRLQRLKYNTLNNYGAAFNSATGAVGVNTGRYQSEPSPSYYTKTNPQPVMVFRKVGKKSYCNIQRC
jgi:hypothetical protein